MYLISYGSKYINRIILITFIIFYHGEYHIISLVWHFWHDISLQIINSAFYIRRHFCIIGCFIASLLYWKIYIFSSCALNFTYKVFISSIGLIFGSHLLSLYRLSCRLVVSSCQSVTFHHLSLTIHKNDSIEACSYCNKSGSSKMENLK